MEKRREIRLKNDPLYQNYNKDFGIEEMILDKFQDIDKKLNETELTFDSEDPIEKNLENELK